MDEVTLDALVRSIAKWQAYANGEEVLVDLRAENCPLCQLYNREQDPIDAGCRKCPVYQRVGQRFCRDTPYQNASRVHKYCGFNSAEFRQAAQAEVEFLKSLLPEDYNV